MSQIKNTAVIFIVIVIVIPLCLPFSTLADEATTTASSTVVSTVIANSLSNATSTPQVLGLQAPAIPPLLAAIKAAKAQLANINLNYAISPVYKNIKNKKTGKIAKTLTGYNLWAKDIALAILDPATQNIIITKGMQTGKTIKFSDPAADITLTHFNGVNSSFQISSPAGGTVVALKYLITGPEQGSKTAIIRALQPSIYVPYSADLASPDVIKYGENYLNNLMGQVTKELAIVPSQSYPGRMLTEAIPPAMIKALVYAEHTDTTTILNGDYDTIRNTVNNLDILLATNEGEAYKYSVSSAGARGIAQFMPATYLALVARHPEAGLISDFVVGMNDHKNSIKAMYLLLDDYAGAVRVKAAQGFSEGQIFDYGAASYNGGVSRVTKAVNTFGTNWNQDNSAQINSLQSQVSSLTSQVKSLKSKVGKAADKKTKAGLQLQLNQSRSQLTDASNQLDQLKSASLKSETVNYLKKIYKVIQIFNGREV